MTKTTSRVSVSEAGFSISIPREIAKKMRMYPGQELTLTFDETTQTVSVCAIKKPHNFKGNPIDPEQAREEWPDDERVGNEMI